MYRVCPSGSTRPRASASSPTTRAATTCSCTSRPSHVDSFKTLQEGQKVTYDVEPNPKNADKLRAVNVVAA